MGKLIKLLTTSCCNSKEKKRQREPQSIEDILGTDTARSSQLTTRSSADTCTLTARKENLEIAVSLLQDSSKRMVEAVNIQIEKAIEIIMSANEDENNTLPEMKNRSVLSNENSKLTQIVHLRTECSKITRNALAEHGEALAQLLLMAQPSIEVKAPFILTFPHRLCVNMDAPVFVITIKLGTKTCGFAFQSRYDFKHNPTMAMSYVFKADSTPSKEFPTSLFLARNGDVSFGYEAQHIFTDSRGEGVYFGNFGENLYLSEDFDERTVITDSTGNEHNALDMFAKYINALYEFIFNELNNMAYQTLRPSDMRWVLTVPSVRADRSVNFFQKGWMTAKITDEVVTVVTYPNAALNYCLYLPAEQCNNVPLHQFKKGQRLMVVGFEEELDSFNVYEKIDDQRFKQVVHFLSGSSTRQLILKALDSFFEDLIGSWIWKTFKILDEDFWQGICQYVYYYMNSTVESGTKIVFRLASEKLTDICFEHTNASLKEIIQSSEYGKQVKLVGDKIRVDSNLITSLFDRGIGKAIHNIGQVLDRSDDKEVNTMIFVGNIANSYLFQHAVKTKYPEKQIITPDGAIHAAVKGAVLFGHKPIVVSSIFCGAQCLVPR